MEKKWLLLPIFTLILIFILIPAGFLSANPGNLFENGDFEDSLQPPWYTTGTVNIITDITKVAELDSTIAPNISTIEQYINTSNKNSNFSFDIKPTAYSTGPTSVGFNIFKNGPNIGHAWYIYNSLPLNTWTHFSFKLSELWYDYNVTGMPDFDRILIFAQAAYGNIGLFDNFYLEGIEATAPYIEPVWVRTQEMTCKQVWVNEDNMFQFSFIYPYRDNNWVRIYDMAGNMVYEIDMPYDNPNIIVDLPNGTYTVKTFTVGSTEPIQTFVIGK